MWSSVAVNSWTGTVTSPKVSTPLQIARAIAHPCPFISFASGFVLCLFGELAGVGGGVLGPAPGPADGPVSDPGVVAGLPGGLPGPLPLAFGVLKLPGQVGDALLGLLPLFLRPVLLLFHGGQLRFSVV